MSGGVIGSNINTSVYDKCDDGFPIVNFPWLSGDVPRLPPYGIYISQLVRFARYCTSVLDFHSKNLPITFDTGLQISQASENVWKVFGSTLLSKCGAYRQKYVSQGIHPVFYGDPTN